VLGATPPPTTTTTTAATTTAVGVVPDGVTLAGVAIGGLTPDAAVQAVTTWFGRPAVLRFQTTRIEVSPSLLGLSIPVASAVARALTAPPFTALTVHASSDGSLVRSFVARIAARFDREPMSSRLLFRDSKPFVTSPVIGLTIQQARAVRDLSSELVQGTRAPIVLRAKLTNPTVTPSSIGPVVVVSRGSGLLTLYDGMTFVRSFAVTTGQTVYPTPLGLFKIVVKWKNPWWYPPAAASAKGAKPVPPGPANPLGSRWLGLNSPGVGIQNTPGDAAIGYSLSHGCIRMQVSAAAWLFDHVNVGTPVYIVAP
jgi:lipoprotein-anchoring transpeptidase ErfK/SrfK